jgi:hypothetical protein
VFWIPYIDNPKALNVVNRGQTGKDLDVTAVTAAAVKVEQPWRFDPGFSGKFF